MRTAWLSVLIAACGSQHALVDGGGGDAGGADGASGVAHVQVHVTSGAGDGTPNVGAKVDAARATGEIVGMTATGADGRASIDAPAGGMIVVTEAANAKTVFAAVEDGDALEIGAPPPPLVEIGTATVDFPLDVGTPRYDLNTGCGAYELGPPAYEITLYAACTWPFAMVVTADHGAQPPMYLVAPPISLADGDEVTLTGTWSAGTSATISVNGLPPAADASSLDVSREALELGRPVSSWAARPVITGGAGSVALWAPVGAGDRQLAYANYYEAKDSVFAYAEGPLGDATLDLGAFPELTHTGTGTWTLGAGAADGIYGAVQYRDDATGATGSLRFVLPPDATTIAAPEGISVVDHTGSGWLVETSTIDGYRAYRARAATTNGIPIATPIEHGLRAAFRFFYI